ncbi:MAG: AIR synthase-related protein, partial [Patescibacteria group bacterium]
DITSRYEIHGMMHITGGAFTKLKDILGNADAHIYHSKKLVPHAIFMEIYKKGISNETMYTAFNCGIGYVLSVSKKEAASVLRLLKGADVIGEIVRGNGNVHIKSAFNGKEVIL